MWRTITPVIGAILLFAGVCLVIIEGNTLVRLGGDELAVLGSADVIGCLMAVVGLVMGMTVFIRDSASGARAYLNLSLYSLFFLGSLVLLYLIAGNHDIKWDATARKYHSLSPSTLQYLKGLRTPVEVAAFHAPGASISKREMLDMLLLYSAASRNIRVNAYNPLKQPFKALEYAEDVRPGDVFIRNVDAATTGASKSRRVHSIDEETITNAIVQVVQGRETTVYFLQGHREKSLDGKDVGSDERVLAMKDFLKDRGFRVEPLNILTNGMEGVDPAAAILVCAGPQTDLKPAERQALEGYLDRGGKALFMLDPILNPSVELTEFHDLLAKHGVETRSDLVYDSLASGQIDKVKFPVIMIPNRKHAIAEDFPNLTWFMDGARTVRKAPYPDPEITAGEFLFSSGQSSYVIDLNEAFKRGRITRDLIKDQPPAQHPLAVAAEKRLPGPSGANAKPEANAKIVVFGDSDVFTDRLWPASSGVSATLLANSINWLDVADVHVPIPSKQVVMAPLLLKESQKRALKAVLVLALPFAIFFGGIAYAEMRRRLG